tara:strand:- start:458 stop:679 length:222 start_codon:yes stop_codon:yes gene_type:complete
MDKTKGKKEDKMRYYVEFEVNYPPRYVEGTSPGVHLHMNADSPEEVRAKLPNFDLFIVEDPDDKMPFVQEKTI